MLSPYNEIKHMHNNWCSSFLHDRQPEHQYSPLETPLILALRNNYSSSEAPFFITVNACHDPKHCRRRFRVTLTKVALNQFRRILLTLQKVELLLLKA